jgi:hypothetical protein
MMGIDALDGFLPRRYKERHVLIREMVACLDSVQGERVEPGPLARDQHQEARIAVASSGVD